MAKTKMNFRLSDDACMSLARLSGLWGCDRTAVVERALAEADPSEMDHEERESTQASMEEVHSTPRVTEAPPACMPQVRKMQGSMTRTEAIPKPTWKTGEATERKSGHTLTGRSHGPAPKGKKK